MTNPIPLKVVSLAIICLLVIGATTMTSALAQSYGVVSHGRANTISVFDLASGTVVATIPSGGQYAFGLAVTPDDSTLLVANLSSNDIVFFDLSVMPPAPLGPPLSIPSGCLVGGVAITQDGRFAVTSHIWCAAPSRVTVIDIGARTVVSQYQVGGASAFDTAVSHDGGTVILNDFFGWTTLSLSPSGVLSGPPGFISSLGQSAQNSIALTPNGRRAIVPNTQSGTASVLAIDAGGNVTNTGVVIPTGSVPAGVAVAPNGRRAYVSNLGNSDLAVLAIDASDNVTDTSIRIPLPQGPPTSQISIQGIAVTDDSARAFVPSYSGGTVSEIDLMTNTVTGVVIPVDQTPTEIVLFGRIIQVLIDIKPGSDPNAVNPRSKGAIPVAILTTSTAEGEPLDFDAWDVDPLTLAFGPNGAPTIQADGHAEDVDGDGDLDMVVHFKTQETGIVCGDTEAILTGQTFGGQTIEGRDAIKTAGCG